MGRLGQKELVVAACPSCDSTKFSPGNSGLLSGIMETLEFLLMDGAWIGDGAEE